MDIPLSLACCTAFHLSCCRKVGFRGDATTRNPGYVLIVNCRSVSSFLIRLCARQFESCNRRF